MRRVTMLFSVLALASLVSVNHASAFGWRGARHQNRHCRSVVAATHHQQAPVQTVTPVAATVSKVTVRSDKPVEANESALLARLLDVMSGILELENDRLDRELEHYRWIEEHDHE